MTEEKVEDATEYCPKVKAIFDSTPFEDVRQKVGWDTIPQSRFLLNITSTNLQKEIKRTI